VSDVSLVFNVIGRDKGATALLGRVGSQVRQTNLAAAASTVVLGTALASAAAHAVALSSAIVPAVGAVALLPGAAFGAAAGLSVLGMATAGLGAALRQTSAGGASSAASIAAAERRIASAQREALAAQAAINDARKEASERLDDLSRSLAGARLDEEAATLAVVDAQRELVAARRGGNVQDIRRADLAYRQSKQTLDEVSARVKDLSTEQTEAAAKGVEGSDAVRTATQRHADALQELADAQTALRTAGAGSGGGIDAMAKLSPNARALVMEIRRLTPAWLALRQAVQDRALAGVASDARALSDTFLPMLNRRLIAMGGAWNLAVRSAAQFARSPETVRDVDRALGDTTTAMMLLGRVFRPVLAAFRDLGAVGATFLPGLAGGTLSLAERFERFVRAARESGQLKQWIGGSLTVLKQLGAIASNVGGAIVAIFRAGGAGEGQGFLAWLVEATAKLSAFLNSAEGQAKLDRVFTTLRSVLTDVGVVLRAVVSDGGVASDSFSVFGTVVGFLADHTGLLSQALPLLAAGFLLVKTAQVGANVAATVSIPLRIIELTQTWGMRAALIANTVALRANTASEITSDVVKKRSIVTSLAHRAATIAGTIATGAATVATFALGAAMWFMTSPIGLIILAVVALIAVFVILWKKNEGFRNFVISAWGAIKDAAIATKDWIVNAWGAVVDFIGGLGAKIRARAHGMWDALVSSFKGSINMIIGLWNRVDFGLNIRVPDWVPGVGGRGFTIPDLFPDLPYLDVGGDIKRTGLAVVHEGERVVPAAQVTPIRNDRGRVETVRIELAGDNEIVKLFRRLARVHGGGDVQVAFGGR
jgi:hypothetical protein